VPPCSITDIGVGWERGQGGVLESRARATIRKAVGGGVSNFFKIGGAAMNRGEKRGDSSITEGSDNQLRR